MPVVDKHITDQEKANRPKANIFDWLGFRPTPKTPSKPSEVQAHTSPGLSYGAPSGGLGRDANSLFHPQPPHAVEYTRDWLNNMFGPGAWTKTPFTSAWTSVFSKPQSAPGNNPGGVNTTQTPGK
jgi:hypothetical protein